MNGECQVQTDSKEKIKLDSDIVDATWLGGFPKPYFPNVPLLTVTIAPSGWRFATNEKVPETVLLPRLSLSKVIVPLVPAAGPA